MIKVSVLLPTYNQEKYIEKALESIVKQNTDFEFEVLVGDDASKDGTGKIVQEYGEKHSDLIKPIIRVKNIGAYKNFFDLFNKASGEYVAFLEGDDYWIDERKLQKQVDFLDLNQDYAAVFGRNIVVDQNDIRQTEIEKCIPAFAGGDYTSLNFENYLLPGQTATAMYRKSVLLTLMHTIENNKKIMPRVPVIDRFLILGILSFGKIYTMTDTFAAYRYILDKSSGSWSSKNDYYSFKNVVFYLYSLKEMERVGKHLNIKLDFDERRWYEFQKVADYKGRMSVLLINAIRFFIWLWFKDKNKFRVLLKERHMN